MHFHVVDAETDEVMGEFDCAQNPADILEAAEDADYIDGGDRFSCVRHSDDAYQIKRDDLNKVILFIYGPYSFEQDFETDEDEEDNEEFENADD